MHIIICLLALFCPLLLTAGSLRHVSPAPSGELMGEEGKPVFLIGTSVRVNIFEGDYERNYPLFKDYPQWLYGRGYAPAKFPLFEKIGFNMLNFFGTTVTYRVLDPEYKGFQKDTQLAEAQAFYRKNEFDKLGKNAALPSEKALREYDELAANAASIPVYLDLHPAGLQARLTSNREAVSKLLSPEKYFASPDKHPTFALRFKLCDPDARELQKKLYVDQAQHFLALGIKPFAYKLFNEADYKDYSPENFRAFAGEMRKRYGSVKQLNNAWRTSYKSFDEIAKGPGGKARDIEFRKFLERQLAAFTGELRDALRTVDSGAVVFSQVHSGAWRVNWNNFNQYLINQHTAYVSFGTGNHTFASGVDADESRPFGECGDNASPREFLARTAFYRALADGKPLLSSEAYIGGFGDRYRQFKAAFWHEMMQGSSMINLWEWGGYWAPWIAPTVSFMLHHPKCVTPESWRAVPETLGEMAQTAEFFQIRANRPKAEVAVLFSYPTLRANRNATEGFVQGVNLVRLRSTPVDAILEEQLGEGRQNRYRVMIAFGVKNVYPETNDLLRKFVENGGTLITDGDSLKHDEYDFPKKAHPLAAPATVAGSGKLQSWDGKKVNFIDSTFFAPPSGAWKSLQAYRNQPLMVKRPLGKGAVIAVTGTWQDAALSQILSPVFDELKLKPDAVVRKYGMDELSPYVLAHKGSSGGMTGWYFVNYTNRPKLVKVSAEEFRNAGAVNFIDRQAYPVDGDSVVLLIPAQYHLVMVTGEKARLQERFGRFDELTPEALKKNYDDEMAELNRNAYVRTSNPVDIKDAANYGFDNQQGWSTPSAWFDGTGRDLKGVPWHGQVFKQLNFDLIRFDFNDNRTCIALQAKNLPEAPEKVEHIPLNAKLRGVAFLHAVTHGKPGETAMTYRFAYEDGSHIDAPVTVGKEIGDWNIAGNSPEVQELCAWQSQGKRGFFLYEWNNPYPSKTLKSLSILSGCGESVPIVAAISALPTRFQKEYGNCIDLTKVMTECSAKMAGNGILPDGSLRFNREAFSISTPNGEPVALPKEKIDSAVLRFRLTVLPDEWGNIPAFHAYCWGTGLLGICDGKPFKTWPDSRLSRVAEAFVHAVREIPNYSSPVEVEVGLKNMNGYDAKPFDAIYGIHLALSNNNVAIHDLRVEY